MCLLSLAQSSLGKSVSTGVQMSQLAIIHTRTEERGWEGGYSAYCLLSPNRGGLVTFDVLEDIWGGGNPREVEGV